MDRDKSGFRDSVDLSSKWCRDIEHNPPTHLHIPHGKEYVHVCPRCRKTTVLKSQEWSL